MKIKRNESGMSVTNCRRFECKDTSYPYDRAIKYTNAGNQWCVHNCKYFKTIKGDIVDCELDHEILKEKYADIALALMD